MFTKMERLQGGRLNGKLGQWITEERLHNLVSYEKVHTNNFRFFWVAQINLVANWAAVVNASLTVFCSESCPTVA